MTTPAANTKSNLLPFGVVLALGMVLSTGIFSGAFERTRPSSRTIQVKGYAEKRITSDRAVWTGTFSSRATELVAAYDKLQKDLGTVTAYLEKRGIARDSIEVSAVSTIALYKPNESGERTNEIEVYVLNQSVTVSSADVGLVTSVANESTSLIKDGVEISSQNPRYFYTKLDDLKLEMLAAATKDARLRAEMLAKNSGGKVGPVRSAEQGVFQITPPYSTDVSGYGVNDTSSLDKTIKAIVAVEYSLK